MACNSTTLKTNACTNGFAQAASDEVLFRALMLQLLCNLSTGGNVTSGVGNPTSSPTSDAAIYFDTSTGAQWNWYSGAWH